MGYFDQPSAAVDPTNTGWSFLDNPMWGPNNNEIMQREFEAPYAGHRRTGYDPLLSALMGYGENPYSLEASQFSPLQRRKSLPQEQPGMEFGGEPAGIGSPTHSMYGRNPGQAYSTAKLLSALTSRDTDPPHYSLTHIPPFHQTPINFMSEPDATGRPWASTYLDAADANDAAPAGLANINPASISQLEYDLSSPAYPEQQEELSVMPRGGAPSVMSPQQASAYSDANEANDPMYPYVGHGYDAQSANQPLENLIPVTHPGVDVSAKIPSGPSPANVPDAFTSAGDVAGVDTWTPGGQDVTPGPGGSDMFSTLSGPNPGFGNAAGYAPQPQQQVNQNVLGPPTGSASDNMAFNQLDRIRTGESQMDRYNAEMAAGRKRIAEEAAQRQANQRATVEAIRADAQSRSADSLAKRNYGVRVGKAKRNELRLGTPKGYSDFIYDQEPGYGRLGSSMTSRPTGPDINNDATYEGARTAASAEMKRRDDAAAAKWGLSSGVKGARNQSQSPEQTRLRKVREDRLAELQKQGITGDKAKQFIANERLEAARGKRRDESPERFAKAAKERESRNNRIVAKKRLKTGDRLGYVIAMGGGDPDDKEARKDPNNLWAAGRRRQAVMAYNKQERDAARDEKKSATDRALALKEISAYGSLLAGETDVDRREQYQARIDDAIARAGGGPSAPTTARTPQRGDVPQVGGNQRSGAPQNLQQQRADKNARAKAQTAYDKYKGGVVAGKVVEPNPQGFVDELKAAGVPDDVIDRAGARLFKARWPGLNSQNDEGFFEGVAKTADRKYGGKVGKFAVDTFKDAKKTWDDAIGWLSGL